MKEFKALKRKNKIVEENALVLKNYNSQIGQWDIVSGAKHNTKKNFFVVRTDNIVYPVNYAVIRSITTRGK